MPKRIPLKLPPGLLKVGTVYESAGRWYDGNLVRFIAGTKQPIGGWRRMVDDSGVPITLLSGTPRGALAWRTDGGALNFAVGTTEKLYVVAGGTLRDITPAGFTQGRQNTTIPQAGVGTPSSEYGDGFYGTGNYGEGPLTATANRADVWQFDSFGDYLAAVCSSDSKLYVWTGNYAVLPTVPAGAPTTARGVVVTPERFLVALGAGGNRRLVQWPSQESITDWTPTADNTAGSFPLSTDGEIVCGVRTRRETLIFTDVDFWTMTYVGSDFVYRFDQAGKQCGIISPRAFAQFGTNCMWMGSDRFYLYDGFVKDIPCDVHDYVFTDFNRTQAHKVWAQTIAQYGEVWFYYPSAGSEEIDRYVCYNHVEGHWTCGDLTRAAGSDAGVVRYPTKVEPVIVTTGPIAMHTALTDGGQFIRDDAGSFITDGFLPGMKFNTTGFTTGGNNVTDKTIVSVTSDTIQTSGGLSAPDTGAGRTLYAYAGRIHEHEFGTDRGDEVPYLESGPVELGDGDVTYDILNLVPDEKALGDAELMLYGQYEPMGEETEYGPFTLSELTDVRMSARQVRVRLRQARETNWRLGTIRLLVEPAGER